MALGSNDYVVLDCDYVVSNESGLEIKWFYVGENDTLQQIYQWIPDMDSRKSIGYFADRIDLKYKVGDDKYGMFRALRIRNVTHDLTGNYTCKVSSYDNESSVTKRLTIYGMCIYFNIDIITYHIKKAQMYISWFQYFFFLIFEYCFTFC